MNYEFLKELLETVSVSGNEEANQEKAILFAKSFAHAQRVDAVGNAVSIVNPDSPVKVLISAHIDEIGFRITHIDSEGFIHVQRAGGVRPMLYVGAPMQIIHESEENGRILRKKVNAVGVTSSSLLKKTDLDDEDLVLDIGAGSKEEAESLVSVGDSVAADSAVRELLGDKITDRALDDKAGVFVILEAARRAAEAGVTTGIYAHTSVGEETTGRGAYFAGAALSPTCCIAVDVTWASDCPGTDPAATGSIKVGAGPVLCLSGMVNKRMNRLLESVAREKNIPLQYEVAGGRTSTDGDTVLKTGSGVPMALVSIPLRYMHSSVEVASLTDLEQCIELIAGFLARAEEITDFSPISL